VTCDPGEGCPFENGLCLKPSANARGVCVDMWARKESPPTVMGYGNGACAIGVYQSFKQSVCCSDVEGFDCRGYDDPARPSAPGELCHTHGDCEPGLLCEMTVDTTIEVAVSGFGRCLCPGVDPATVQIEPDCLTFSGPAEWGSPPEPLPADCVSARSPGYVVEVLARGVQNPQHQGGQLAAVVDGANQLHVVASDGALVHFVKTSSGLVREVISELPGLGASAAFDSQGHLHVATGAESEAHARYASNASGEWAVTNVGDRHGASSVRLVLDGAEKPHFVYVDRDHRLHTAEPSDQGFTVRDKTP
jgi:hypothetical protein